MSIESENRLSALLELDDDLPEEETFQGLAHVFESQFPTTKSRRRRGSDSEVVVPNVKDRGQLIRSRNEAATHRFNMHIALDHDHQTNCSPIMNFRAVTPERPESSERPATPERQWHSLEKAVEDTTPNMVRRKIVSESEIRR